MFISDWGAIGDEGAGGSLTVVDEEDLGLQIRVAEDSLHHHTMGNMSVGKYSPQAYHAQGNG